MAAEIRPGSGAGSSLSQQQQIKFSLNRKPVLVGKVEGFTEDLNDARLIPNEDGVITAGDDKTVQIWLKRDSGQYWPSVCQYVPSQASCLQIYDRKIFIGLENGTVIIYNLAPDCNKLEHVLDILSHIGRVTGIQYNNYCVLSISRDKNFVWADERNGNIIGCHAFNAWLTELQYDQTSSSVFIGDFSGQITMLKLDLSNKTITVVTTFKGHTGSVRSLYWEANSNLLFSGAFDSNVCVWDIGGGRGQVYELQGHKGKVTGLTYINKSSQLISGGEDSVLVAWDMKVSRAETAAWKESDYCEVCKKPFFWNLKAMFDSKTLGQRQHHCRACGRAVCDKCSGKRLALPRMGFEFQVRVCDECAGGVKEADLTSLASFHEAKHSIITLSSDPERNLLLTVGADRVIKIWDISPLILGSSSE